MMMHFTASTPINAVWGVPQLPSYPIASTSYFIYSVSQEGYYCRVRGHDGWFERQRDYATAYATLDAALSARARNWRRDEELCVDFADDEKIVEVSTSTRLVSAENASAAAPRAAGDRRYVIYSVRRAMYYRERHDDAYGFFDHMLKNATAYATLDDALVAHARNARNAEGLGIFVADDEKIIETVTASRFVDA